MYRWVGRFSRHRDSAVENDSSRRNQRRRKKEKNKREDTRRKRGVWVLWLGPLPRRKSYASWSSHCGEKFASFEGLSRRALVPRLECIRVLRPPPAGASISRLYCTGVSAFFRSRRRMFGATFVRRVARRATRRSPATSRRWCKGEAVYRSSIKRYSSAIKQLAKLIGRTIREEKHAGERG